MLKEIQEKYEQFSDALISQIVYNSSGNEKSAQITIRCMNKLNDYQFEVIKLQFEDIISIRFIESFNSCSTVINSALLTQQNEIIVFDFFPDIYSDGLLQENDNSDFKIKCMKLSYELSNQ
jgi:hypothetical protein